MRKEIKFKPYVLPTLFVLFAILVFIGVYYYNMMPVSNVDDEITYVSDEIIEHTKPVIDVPEVIGNPYSSDGVTIARDFYDYKADSGKQEGSLVDYDNTFLQNTGVDFVKSETFVVTSVLSGTVLSVEDTELFGKSVSIKHNNGLISVYQGLSNVFVLTDDNVKQGQTIGESGTSIINKELGNHLHFELYNNGNIINPVLSIGKAIEELNQ